MSGNDDKPPPEPKIFMTEEVWEKVVAIGVLAVVAIGVVGAIRLNGGDPATFDQRLENFWRIMVIAGGLLTFVSIVWRGLIATRQADQQRDQIEAQQQQLRNVATQIAQTDENNLAGLLQKGAELLADSAKPSHVTAGIAILHSVATADNRRFTVPAMDLLAGFIEANSSRGHGVAIVKAAIDALNSAHDSTGMMSSRGIVCGRKGAEPFPLDGADDDGSNWIPIRGVQFVAYLGGFIIRTIHVGAYDFAENSHFENVYLKLFEITEKNHAHMEGCTLYNCNIKYVNMDCLYKNRFEECNFSEAFIQALSLPNADRLKGENNYFIAGAPPVLSKDGDAPGEPVSDWAFLEERPFFVFRDGLRTTN